MATTSNYYFFKRHRGSWAIFTLESEINGIRTYNKVDENWNYENVVRETYRLNNWRQPKQVIKRFYSISL